MSKIMDGKLVSQKVRNEIKDEVSRLGIKPHLAVVIVGTDAASQTYVNNKHKACHDVGFQSTKIELPAQTTEEELLQVIDKLNADKGVHGILVQLPLPKHIKESVVLEAIDQEKDVDGFHPYQVGLLATGLDGFKPCTAAGVIEILKHYEVPMEGSHAVIVGRSHIVGKPLIQLLLDENATVTVAHSRTKDLASVTKLADIVIVAVGIPGILTADMVKEGAVVVDVGINRLDTGKLVGDVDFEPVMEKASLITPVPGGVGPMTITMLLANTLKSAKKVK
ncbi:MAG: bifunctional methylenetetrahydrofolate dehydrogenase/methenyltetrahydrofolate cyclohydrolase FolD [Turicibacter sp.]|nr:bifunctional methylenetetrahydrofolate dehydrogenase/methenyltetrahydrofolate cyclohydrolase FolD [Turicibacter sp.]